MMAGLRTSFLKCLRHSVRSSLNVELNQSYHHSMNLTKHAHYFHVRIPGDSLCHAYAKSELQSPEKLPGNRFGYLASQSPVNSHLVYKKPNGSVSPKFSTFVWNALPFTSMTPILNYRSYSSSMGGKGSGDGETGVRAGSGANDMNTSSNSGIGSDWVEKVKDAWQSAVETATHTGQKVKDASDELTPYAQQFLDSHPYIKDVIIPVGNTLGATMIAWIVMPWILRKFHRYSMEGPAAVFPGSISGLQVPYEKSFWGALEDPVRYLVTFMAFSQICVMVAPTTIASQYLSQAWRGAVILSFIWFLHRWKTNVFTRIISSQGLLGLDREKLLTLDKISSVGLFIIGLMALAEACGVAVQSVVTVGGIGGVATAFAARDILGNVLSGLSMQFSEPFSTGDIIKAGSVEGQVIEMGLTSTSLLNSEKFPVIVPNSFFSSQAIVNKSRAECHATISKIPLQIEELNKIPQISDDIKSMLKSNAKVFLGNDAPYCFMSSVGSSYAELTLGYNLKYMRKDELYSAEQEILLQAVQIIKKHGVALGSAWQDTATR